MTAAPPPGTDDVLTVVVDALAVSRGSSAVVVGGVLAGWAEHAPGDRVVVVSGGELPFELPAAFEHVVVTTRVPGTAGRLWLRLRGVAREARRRRADAVLLGVTAGRLRGITARRGAIVYDLRHEVHPEQFGRLRRLVRSVTYGRTARAADVLVAISERSRADLVRRYPVAAPKAVAALLGSDHVDAWPRTAGHDEPPYALAFGHFANKNVDAVLRAWVDFTAQRPAWVLRLIGLGAGDRAAATEQVAALGIADRVELMPWLDDDQFAACFTGASLVVFPSDFEGFGLPVIEALRLQVPCVTSGDAALREVGGGHAVVAEDLGPGALAASMVRAVDRTAADAAAGRAWTEGFTWAACAAVYRRELAGRGVPTARGRRVRFGRARPLR